MKAFRNDGQGTGGVPEPDLRGRDDEIDDENATEDADDGIVAIGHREFKMQRSTCKQAWTNRVVFASCDLHFERDTLAPSVQKTRACGIGHHRSWTFPIMYFFGTMPQCRLSELLFR